MTDFITGPVRTPENRARGARGSIHDDATAQRLGFKGGTVAGSVHMDQFPPVLLEAFGPAWFESGSLSLAFKNATSGGDPVIAMVERPARATDVQVEARMETPDATLVAIGTAGVGQTETRTHLEAIDVRASGDGLRLLEGIEPGKPLAEHDEVLDPAALRTRIEGGGLTEPLDWYTGPSPWGPPVACPSQAVQLLRNRAGDFGRRIADAVGLFGAIEVRHHHGPLLTGVRYHVAGEVAAVGASPKTEYVWYDTRAVDDDGRLIASMRMQLRWMKASSPLYQEV